MDRPTILSPSKRMRVALEEIRAWFGGEGKLVVVMPGEDAREMTVEEYREVMANRPVCESIDEGEKR